jgi:SHAQKYF class myb-like DNA-binding protein
MADDYIDDENYEGNYDGIYEADEMVAAAVDHEDYENEHEHEQGHQPRHTKFLDLTQGEMGGAGGAMYYGDPEADTTNTVAAASSSNAAARDCDQDDVDALVDAHLRANAHNMSRGTMRVDPNTPGKVVEAGQEHTGRWTKEEHESFLSALQMYGKEWKKVAAKVKTRTVVQTRTHAQKYFQKLQKAMESGGSKEDVDAVEMGTALEAKKLPSAKKKRGTPSIASKPRPPSITAPTQSQMLSSLTTAAQSIQTPTGDSQARLNNHVAAGGFAAAAAVATSGGLGLSSNAAAILSRTQAGHSQLPRHGFSTGSDSFRSQYGGGGFAPLSDRGWAGSTAMKITAPDPDASIKSGSFPEPSPAACGKRKLAEIAAARMLAGVAAGGKPLLLSAVGGDHDGDVTPPAQRSPRTADAPGLTLSDVPAPPLIGGGLGASAPPNRKGALLQIVNPESLGVDYEETKRRRESQALWFSETVRRGGFVGFFKLNNCPTRLSG